MYSEGDQIIHPRYGAGIIIGEKNMTLYGSTRSYHIVELVGGRGEVMIPKETVDDMDIRPALANMDVIEEVFAKAPTELSDDYRARQAKIQKKITNREPKEMAQALRDLAWREHTDKLTAVEQKMKSRLMKMLSREMAVMRPNMNVEKATNQLTQMLYDMVNDHGDSDSEVAST